MQKDYDFTGARLGRKIGPYNRRVIVCGKCGRRGTDDGVLGKSQAVTHRGHIESVAGLTFFHTDDWCSVPVQAEVA